jgi:hypothetical protein
VSNGEPTLHDHERRLSRLEAWMDTRLLTRDVWDISMKNVVDRLDKTEDNIKWLMRFSIMALVGVVLNVVVVAVTTLGR